MFKLALGHIWAQILSRPGTACDDYFHIGTGNGSGLCPGSRRTHRSMHGSIGFLLLKYFEEVTMINYSSSFFFKKQKNED